MKGEETETGTVYIEDAWETFFQTEQPYYDVMVEKPNEKCPRLYKHLPESCLTKADFKEEEQ